MAPNIFLYFLLATGLILGTAVGAYEDEVEELAKDFIQQDSSREDELLKRKCPPKEHWDRCNAACQKNCSNINDNPGICPDICKPGCVCDTGFLRGPSGRCIKPKECPTEVKCPTGEHFDKCLFNCQRNCSNWNQTFIPCNAMCLPGCVCDAGTVRSKLPSGKCIKPKDCKKPDEDEVKCPVGEHFRYCRFNCQRNCSNWNDKDVQCKGWCIPGCLCDEGTVRSELPRGKCIKPELCKKSDEGRQFCPLHEEFAACDALCELDCSNKTAPCYPGLCVPGCKCQAGYVRGPKGTCIRPEECPGDDETVYPVKRECPRNEHWDINAHCQPNCTNHGQQIPCPRILIFGCVCDKNFYRDSNGKCVPVEKCPKKEDISSDRALHVSFFCKRNEIWSLCPSTCPDNCTNYQDKDRKCIPLCIPGCVCRSGYIKGPTGDCIKPDMCPREKRPEDCTDLEYYDTCGTACEDNCTNYNRENKTCDKRCKIGCFCRPGYIRDSKGDCIWPFDCQTSTAEIKLSDHFDEATETKVRANFCPPNEEFIACQGLCELDCRTRNRTLPECRGYCVSSCRCVSGYVRGPNGTCIKPDKCPENDPTHYPVERVCPADEVWSGFAHCQTNCTHPKPVVCPRIIVKGCVCKKGWKRRPDGKCIPQDKCAPLKGAETSEDSEELDNNSTDDYITSEFCMDSCHSSGYRGGYSNGPSKNTCNCY